MYGISYLLRHVMHDVMHYNWLLIRPSDMEVERHKAIDRLVAAARAFAALGHERGFHVVTVLHPDYFDAAHQTYEYSFAEVVNQLKRLPEVEVVDVLDEWKSSGLLARDGASALYWRIDGHNNSKGYAAFGEVVANEILRKGLMTGE